MIKDVVFRTRYKDMMLAQYQYMFLPTQLMLLCECLEETRNIPGSIAEIGCAFGDTTIFLNKYMDEVGLEKDYVAVDTFSGFVTTDVDAELQREGKRAFETNYRTYFSENKKLWYDRAVRRADINRVRSVETDVNLFDLRTLGPLSFCLLDVDLYRPMTKALPELYEALSPGGIIAVDDCDAEMDLWDSADHAYKEFVASIGKPVDIQRGKIGIIRKDA